MAEKKVNTRKTTNKEIKKTTDDKASRSKITSPTKESSVQIESLFQMSMAIVSSRYLEEILQLIVQMTAEMMNSKICSIMLLDDEKGELIIKATQALSAEYRSKPNIKVGQSISGLAVKQKEPIAVQDVTIDPLYKYPVLAKKEGLKSMLAVPMMIKDKVIGVVNSYTARKHNFSDEEIKLLQIVASKAAIAIENTRLVDQAAAMKEALEARKLIERAKGILMKKHKISEDHAFEIIQRQSMNTRQSTKEIAKAVIITSEIKL